MYFRTAWNIYTWVCDMLKMGAGAWLLHHCWETLDQSLCQDHQKKDLLLVAPVPGMTAESLAHYTFKVTKPKSLKTANRENEKKNILEQLNWSKWVRKQLFLLSILHVIYPFKVSDHRSNRFSLLETSLRLQLGFKKQKLTFSKFLKNSMFKCVLFTSGYELLPNKTIEGPERMWSLHPWSYQNPQAWTWATCSVFPCFEKGVGEDHLQRWLPACAIVWAWGYIPSCLKQYLENIASWDSWVV